MGGGSESNTVAKYEPPEFTKPFWEEAVARAYDISNVYGAGKDLSWQGPFAAPLVREQVDAIGGLRGMAMPMFGNPAHFQQQADQQNQTLMSALGGGMSNPYGGATNPAFEDMLSRARQGMTDSFAKGTAAQTDAAAARAGAFGGSAHNQMVQDNARTLADSIGQMESGARSEQYNRAAGLAESGFNRQLQALGLMPGIQAGNVNLLQSLLGAGEMSRGLDQKELEGQIGRHYQNVQQPLMAMDILFNALTRAGGGAGTTSSTIMGPGFSPVQGGLGALGLLGGLFG